MRNFAWYTGNLTWLKDRTIFLTKSGSHAYGTNLPTSDLDLKGVCIPPREYFLGWLHRFEQAETKGAVDAVIYDLRKFFALAADCNPNIIEVLFADPADAIVTTPAWERIRARRQDFVSKKAMHTFSGYAVSQLKRIKTHRRWLLDPPKEKPERLAFGLPENSTLAREQFGVIEAKLKKMEDVMGGRGFTKDRLEEADEAMVGEAVKNLELSPNLIGIIVAERRYNAAMRNWAQFEQWKAGRNETRAALERDHGFDSKHGMHLVRLMRMAIEILRDGQVITKRPDAEELLSIRHGAWTFDRLMAWAETTEAELQTYYAASPLPREPDRSALDALLVDVVGDALSL